MSALHPSIPKDVTEFLTAHKTYYLVAHIEPDGDCLAAALGLGMFLNRVHGKFVRYFDSGPFDRREIQHLAQQFENRLDPTTRAEDPDPAVVVVDCANLDRVGSVAEDLADLPTAVIDHHPTGEPFGDVRFVETSAPATCYLIQLIIEEMGATPTQDEAEMLLFGIATDTGYFRHTEANAAGLFAAVSRLLVAGASPKRARQQMFGGYKLASRFLLARLIGRARVLENGAAIVTWETLSDVEEFGRGSRDSDTLYELLFAVDGVRMIGLVREEPNGKCTGSLRSIDTIDVSKVAVVFGGGGHRRAAGFTISGSVDAIRDQVVDEFLSALKHSPNS
ncbi:MAG: bifunctional oligoribonuclease/PAP phosphatase NrnA [Spirochaetia bacterium]